MSNQGLLIGSLIFLLCNVYTLLLPLFPIHSYISPHFICSFYVSYTLCSFIYFLFIHIYLLISYAPSSIHAYDQFLHFCSIKSLISFSLMYYSLYCLCTIKISPFLSHYIYIYICFNLHLCCIYFFCFP